MTLHMSETGDKVAVVEAPTYIVTPRSTEASTGSPSKGIQKKHVLIVIGMVFLAGLVIAGILIGMHIFAEAQKEIVKFSLNFKSSNDGKNVKQDIEADPNDNVVKLHLNKDGKDVWVVNDFNREIQVVKIEFGYGINCYVSPLNRSAAMDPGQVSSLDTDVSSNDRKKSASMVFAVSETPVSDRSFLPKKAQEMCKDVSVYWAYRSCNGQTVPSPHANSTDVKDRDRRALYNAGYYGTWPCLNGCCWTYCSCAVAIYEQYYAGVFYCTYYGSSACGFVKYRQATPGQIC